MWRRGQSGDLPKEVLKAADLAMYQAKAEGRDRVATASGETGEDEAVERGAA